MVKRYRLTTPRLRLIVGGGALALALLALVILGTEQFDTWRFLSLVVPDRVVLLTNQERAAQALPALVTNERLTKAAQAKADDMAARGYFSHTTPEGRTPWYWLEQAGYSYGQAGENLAVNYYESETVTTAWMQSPAHRANILRPEFSEIGIGVARGEYQGAPALFVVQFFGRPQ